MTHYYTLLLQRSNIEKQAEFAAMRNLPLKAVQDAGIIYIENMAEMLVPEYIDRIDGFGVISNTNKKPIFSNRYLIPIRDANGKVLNFVGYSKDAMERYVYGTSKFYKRKETLYGLENINKAYNCGYFILAEGITDAIRLKSLGYEVSFGNCGTHSSDFIFKQLNRCVYGGIIFTDRDDAGVRAKNNWKKKLLKGIIVNPPLIANDVDEVFKDNDNTEDKEKWVKSYIDLCIQQLKKSTHRGNKGVIEEITIL